MREVLLLISGPKKLLGVCVPAAPPYPLPLSMYVEGTPYPDELAIIPLLPDRVMDIDIDGLLLRLLSSALMLLLFDLPLFIKSLNESFTTKGRGRGVST